MKTHENTYAQITSSVIQTLVLMALFTTETIGHNIVVVVPLFESDDGCTAPDEVKSLGKCWKDRNVGAERAATNLTDVLAYGDRYQWGRLGDGHQYSTSEITTDNSHTDVPRHSDFITESIFPWDWRVPQNTNLWQGLEGVNNPCSQGFRLPTEAELDAERASWVSNDAAGAFASPLKLVAAGIRTRYDGNLLNEDITGAYWSSSIDGSNARVLIFHSDALVSTSDRAPGYSVRCIKD